MVADLFTFNDDNLPTPRELPDGWRVAPSPSWDEGLVLVWGAERYGSDSNGGRLVVRADLGRVAPDYASPEQATDGTETRRPWGLRVQLSGYYMRVQTNAEVSVAEAPTVEETHERYASRLLDLLTWIPGPAGDGWRRRREDVGKRPAAEVFAELRANLPPVDIEAFLRARKSGACERNKR